MTHTVCVRFAPVVNADRLNNPTWERPGRTMYWSRALRFLPTQTEIPLLVDHNMERQVGVVHELFEMDWTNDPWICARATVTDPPAGLRRYETKASFGRWNIHATEVGECERVTSAFVREVSLLSPAHEPNEPLACVLSIRPTEARPARSPRETAAGAIVIPANGQLIRRGIGQVLGVR